MATKYTSFTIVSASEDERFATNYLDALREFGQVFAPASIYGNTEDGDTVHVRSKK